MFLSGCGLVFFLFLVLLFGGSFWRNKGFKCVVAIVSFGWPIVCVVWSPKGAISARWRVAVAKSVLATTAILPLCGSNKFLKATNIVSNRLHVCDIGS